MKKLLLVLAMIAPLILGSSVAFAGQKDGSNAPPYSNTTTQPRTGTVGDSNDPSYDPNAAATVIVSSSGYSPAHVTVPVDSTVMWINQDTGFHTVTSNASGGPESRKMYPGKAYSFRFRQPGTYTYYCLFHPNMTGTVTVTGASSGSDTTTPPASQKPAPTMPSTAETPPTGTSDGGSSSSSTSSATANTYVSVENAPRNDATSAPQPQTPSAAKTYPTELPATGVSDAVIAFGAASAVGAGVYSVYTYARRKLIGG